MTRYESGVVPLVHQLREAAFAYDGLVDLLEETLRSGPGRSVLSLGCGTCSVELRLARRGFSVRGLDLDAGVVEFARRRCGVDVELEVGDATGVLDVRGFDAILVLYSEFPLETLRSIAARAALSAKPGALLVANLPFSPAATIGSTTSFVDILAAGGGTCLSVYRRDVGILRGEEVYVVDRGDGVARLHRDFTRLPIECDSFAALRSVAEGWTEHGWSVQRLFALNEKCPSAAPPFCGQALIVWRLDVPMGGRANG